MAKIKTTEEIIKESSSIKSGLDSFYGYQTITNAIKRAQRNTVETMAEMVKGVVEITETRDSFGSIDIDVCKSELFKQIEGTK